MNHSIKQWVNRIIFTYNRIFQLIRMFVEFKVDMNSPTFPPMQHIHYITQLSHQAQCLTRLSLFRSCIYIQKSRTKWNSYSLKLFSKYLFEILIFSVSEWRSQTEVPIWPRRLSPNTTEHLKYYSEQDITLTPSISGLSDVFLVNF